jgi:hypothetical protein
MLRHELETVLDEIAVCHLLVDTELRIYATLLVEEKVAK